MEITIRLIKPWTFARLQGKEASGEASGCGLELWTGFRTLVRPWLFAMTFDIGHMPFFS